jgi:hypothetical protein
MFTFLGSDDLVSLMNLNSRSQYDHEALHELLSNRLWSFNRASAFSVLHPKESMYIENVALCTSLQLDAMVSTDLPFLSNVKHMAIDINECNHDGPVVEHSQKLIKVKSLPSNLTSLFSSIGWINDTCDVFPMGMRQLLLSNKMRRLGTLDLSVLPHEMKWLRCFDFDLHGFLPETLKYLEVAISSMSNWLYIDDLPTGLHTLILDSPEAIVPSSNVWKRFTHLRTLDLTLNWSTQCRSDGCDPVAFLAYADVPRTVTTLRHATFGANDTLRHLPSGLTTLNLTGYCQGEWRAGDLPDGLCRLELDIRKPLTLTAALLPTCLTALNVSIACNITIRSLPPALHEVTFGLRLSDVMKKSQCSEHIEGLDTLKNVRTLHFSPYFTQRVYTSYMHAHLTTLVLWAKKSGNRYISAGALPSSLKVLRCLYDKTCEQPIRFHNHAFDHVQLDVLEIVLHCQTIQSVVHQLRRLPMVPTLNLSIYSLVGLPVEQIVQCVPERTVRLALNILPLRKWRQYRRIELQPGMLTHLNMLTHLTVHHVRGPVPTPCIFPQSLVSLRLSSIRYNSTCFPPGCLPESLHTLQCQIFMNEPDRRGRVPFHTFKQMNHT